MDEAEVALVALRRVGAVAAARRASDFVTEHATERQSPSQAREHGFGIATLTPREREVLVLVGAGPVQRGHLDKALVITEKTAGHHVSHILTKLGVRNRTEAATRSGQSH